MMPIVASAHVDGATAIGELWNGAANRRIGLRDSINSGDDMAGTRGICLLAMGAAGLCLMASGAGAQTSTGRAGIDRGLQAFAQAQPPRPRVRIRISPRCRVQSQTLEYPPPWNCNAPGPGYVRNCNARLVQENRPSGPTIVPETTCWWERG